MLKAKKTFSEWLTNRYMLVVRNEENFAEKTTLSFNYAKVIALITTTFVVLFSLSFYLSSTILAKWFHPAGRELVINKQIIALSATVDSLELEIAYRDKTLHTLLQIVEGDDAYLRGHGKPDSTQKRVVPSLPEVNEFDSIAFLDKDLRQQFDYAMASPARLVSNTSESLHDQFLFAPITGGVITERFSTQKAHYGIDVVAKKDEPVKCVADGTVLLASWTNDSGYVIAVQHQGNMVSMYKHNSVLLKKAGNFVRAGEIISVTGNSGELTSGPHLHFELWYKNNPVNPETFISF